MAARLDFMRSGDLRFLARGFQRASLKVAISSNPILQSERQHYVNQASQFQANAGTSPIVIYLEGAPG
jgi:hypothetical protein